MTSVLQDWVQTISLRKQGVLLLALRGPDGHEKEDPAKPLVRTLRALVMVSGREGKPMEMGTQWRDDPFMSTYWIANPVLWYDTVDKFFASIDHYNIHSLQHLFHAYEVLAFEHPNGNVAKAAQWLYERSARALHYNPETREQFDRRLRDGKRDEDAKLARP